MTPTTTRPIDIGTASRHHLPQFLPRRVEASVVVAGSYQQGAPDHRCHLPRLPPVVLERAGEMSGVKVRWRVANMR